MNKQELRSTGDKLWFEYHCWESPESSDAEVWYHSHQRVTVLRIVNEPVLFDTFAERADAGCQVVYKARFDDGLEWDVFEDELLDSKNEFERPDPPVRGK